MGTRKSLRLSGVLAIAALLGATNVSATPPPTHCVTTDFSVDVTMHNTGGVTSYEYSMSSPTGKTPSKFFAYVKGRQSMGQGLQGDLQGSLAGVPAGSYVLNGSTSPACVSGSAWTLIKDRDGYCFPTVSITSSPMLTVSERDKPEEGTTNVVIATPTSYQTCGPILGPTTPAAMAAGSPLVAATVHQTFANGCAYFLTVDGNNFVIDVTADPATPHATVSPFEACTVTTGESICEIDLVVAHCPSVRPGEDVIQGMTGGTCYYPPNKKFTC